MENVYQLNDEVKVEIFRGAEFTGKIVDINSYNTIYWVERAEDSEWFMVDPKEDKIELVQKEEAFDPSKLPAEDVLTMTELKAKIKEELKNPEYNRADIESVKVAVYNSSEGSVRIYGQWIEDIECWDCEVQIELDNGESIYPTFGTFYNEEDALKHARDMRVKLNRSTYDITDKVWVYSC